MGRPPLRAACQPGELMLVIVGFVMVLGCVIAGFTMAGGNVMSLIHLSEIVTIGGASLGAMIVMSPKKVLVDLVKGVLQCFKGSPFGKKAYEEVFAAMYELARLARRDGMLALESHLNDPHHSPIFSKYPTVAKNHHVVQFICGALGPLMDGSVTAEQLPTLMDAELKALENEHHGPISVLSKTADALPGFGIVAAVLGIVVTMGAIDGPVEEIGHKVGAALVGTFLGILLSYGFFAPLVVKMEFMGAAESAFFRTLAGIVQGFADQTPPKVTIEMARRGLASDVRPGQQQIEEMLKALDTAA
jgi:chemotaxis protein MotA